MKHFNNNDSGRQGRIKSPFVFSPLQNKLPRNAFPLSRHALFSSPVGLMLPVFCQEVIPGDFLKLNLASFTRTEPLNTAAFARLREVTDFFFVPYSLLWSPYGSFMQNVNDYNSALLTAQKDNNGRFNKIPNFRTADLMQLLKRKYVGDIFGCTDTFNRIAELLGYPHLDPDGNVPNANDSVKSSFVLQPFRALAYQKIWSDFFRLSDYVENDPSLYNIDDLKGPMYTDSIDTANGYLTTTNGVSRLGGFFTPHYVPWNKDRYSGVKPSRFYPSNGSASDILSFSPSPFGTGAGGHPVQQFGDNPYIVISPSVLDTSTIRNLLAADKLSRISMLAPKYFSQQVLAHYGAHVDRCESCSTKFLGSFSSSLQIGEVVSTAAGSTPSGSTSVPGQINGRGIASSNGNKPIQFEVNQFGIVMGIHYFIPESEYDADMVDDFNTKVSRDDFFTPEYDQLGFQPLLGANCNFRGSYFAPNDVLGYQARYAEYKSVVDKVYGQFKSNGMLRDWTLPRQIGDTDPDANDPTNPMDFVRFLLVNPHLTDSISALAFDGTDKTDLFLCHFNFACNMVRSMSVNQVSNL